VVEPPAGWLAGVQRVARAAGALLICDEVQSGVGRTGTPLACHREGVLPDLVTVGKGLGGGFPVAAVLLKEAVAATVSPGEHGSTFGGGPLAAAAVKATLTIIAEEHLLERARTLESALRSALGPVPGVVAIRGAGVWLGVVIDRPAKPVAAALLERGFVVGCAADPYVLRLSPPAVLPLFVPAMLAEQLATLLGD
jgi:acetylornithine/succinyldiaminopimelate/putrescine aminotransferase